MRSFGASAFEDFPCGRSEIRFDRSFGGQKSFSAVDDHRGSMRQTNVQGKVKWFNNSKGYGFIGRDDGPDVFVHYTAVVGDGYRTLQEGDSVEFEIVQGPKGRQASNVVVTNS